MQILREALGDRSTVPQDIVGYLRLGIRVIREACKDTMFNRGIRKRKAARWLLGYELKEECTFGWYLDHLGSCGVTLPPRSYFRILAEESLGGARWKRDKQGRIIKIAPEPKGG